MKDLIEDARREKVREEELRGLSGYVGRRQAPPAYAAGIEDNNKNCTAPAKGDAQQGLKREAAVVKYGEIYEVLALV